MSEVLLSVFSYHRVHSFVLTCRHITGYLADSYSVVTGHITGTGLGFTGFDRSSPGTLGQGIRINEPGYGLGQDLSNSTFGYSATGTRAYHTLGQGISTGTYIHWDRAYHRVHTYTGTGHITGYTTYIHWDRAYHRVHWTGHITGYTGTGHITTDRAYHRVHWTGHITLGTLGSISPGTRRSITGYTGSGHITHTGTGHIRVHWDRAYHREMCIGYSIFRYLRHITGYTGNSDV